MKRVLLIFWMIVMSVISAMSQTNNYVVQVEERESKVYVYTNPQEYVRLSDIGKTALLKKEASKYDVKTICVVCGNIVELWQLDGNTLTKVDSWDKDSVATLSGRQKTSASYRRSLKHPWFFNFGGALNYNITDDVYTTSSTLSYNAYGRLGFYLLKGRWDAAINCLIGYNKTKNDSKGSYSNSIGVDTRVYILRGKSINPFAGIGVAYAFGGGESSVTLPITAGLSIPVKGKGSIDFCYQYNKVTKSAFIVGYTYMHK